MLAGSSVQDDSKQEAMKIFASKMMIHEVRVVCDVKVQSGLRRMPFTVSKGAADSIRCKVTNFQSARAVATEPASNAQRTPYFTGGGCCMFLSRCRVAI